jgi:hypothetical protein
MTTDLFRTECNAITGESKNIPLTAAEIADLKLLTNQIEMEKLAKEEKAIAKNAILEKLGLTADEAAILLG